MRRFPKGLKDNEKGIPVNILRVTVLIYNHMHVVISTSRDEQKGSSLTKVGIEGVDLIVHSSTKDKGFEYYLAGFEYYLAEINGAMVDERSQTMMRAKGLELKVHVTTTEKRGTSSQKPDVASSSQSKSMPIKKSKGKGKKKTASKKVYSIKNAFEELKATMIRGPILGLVDVSKSFEVETDASEYALGGVLMQEDHPVAYESRKLNNAERRYTV
ncbi:uncharacterized protein LOC120084726 [Benincasa hispida]|uniref:uncharacterized protein LOC120084726 n=1 Tax=Benincasa hispida TaxID=102211 RepID=UPI001900E17C|nr:uncharacterized protein LOC120084726 [Benincasa hispida]